MIDMETLESAPALIIVASDAAHCGNVVFRPMYCKQFFYVPSFCFIYVCILACLFNLKESERSKRLNWVAFAWITNYDYALAPDWPTDGVNGCKYLHLEYEHQ